MRLNPRSQTVLLSFLFFAAQVFCVLKLDAAWIAYDGADYDSSSSISGLNEATGWDVARSGVDNVVADSLVINGAATVGNRLVTDVNVEFGPATSRHTPFKVTVAASPPVQQTLTKVFNFGGPYQSQASLIEAPDGTLYGWDLHSDENLKGQIFQIKKDGSGFGTVHAFGATDQDGDNPRDLIYGSDGTLYGVATDTQARTGGRLFTLSANGNDFRTLKLWTLSVDKTAGLLGVTEARDGKLYGVTGVGGTLGAATIWRIGRDGTGFEEIYNFEAGEASPDTTFGDSPLGKLTEGPDSKIYGVATGGSAGRGRIYRLNRDGTGFENIHEFAGNGAGSGPFGNLRYGSDGFFYGIGHNGGVANHPVVYRLKPDGTAYEVLTTADVANFNAANRLVETGDGYLYGTSSSSGQFVAGTIFRVRRDGSGFEVLRDFSPSDNPAYGISPSPMFHASDGYFYFITQHQTVFVGTPQSEMLLLRFGPAPLVVDTTPTAPAIVTQPQPQIVTIGTNASFSVRVSGTEPLSFQWRLNGGNIPGATNDNLIITNIQVANAGTYSVTVGNSIGVAESHPVRLLLQTPALQPADHFADRVAVPNQNGTIAGSNTLATLEPGEPAHGGKPGGKSVWFTWRAPQNGIAMLTTAGSDFDALLAVYAGSSLATLTPVAADDDAAGFLNAQVSFNAISGVDYQIAIDGFAGASGEFLLSGSFEPTPELLPAILPQSQAQTITLGSGTTFNTAALIGGDYQWFHNGQLIPGATNNSFTIPSVLASNVGVYFVRIRSGTRTVDEPTVNLEINQSPGGSQSVHTTDKFGDVVAEARSQVRLQSLEVAALRKLSVARGFTGTQIFSTYGSTKEPGEPNHCGVIGGASRWFALQAEASGTMTVDTSGSGFDTVLAVYTANGFDFSTLSLVTCNNDTDVNDKSSRVTFAAKEKEIYYVVVDGVGGAAGTVFLNYALAAGPHLDLLIATGLEPFHFRVSGLPGKSLGLQHSTNLINWFPVLSTNPAAGIFEYVETLKVLSPAHFYRVEQ